MQHHAQFAVTASPYAHGLTVRRFLIINDWDGSLEERHLRENGKDLNKSFEPRRFAIGAGAQSLTISGTNEGLRPRQRR